MGRFGGYDAGAYGSIEPGSDVPWCYWLMGGDIDALVRQQADEVLTRTSHSSLIDRSITSAFPRARTSRTLIRNNHSCPSEAAVACETSAVEVESMKVFDGRRRTLQ